MAVFIVPCAQSVSIVVFKIKCKTSLVQLDINGKYNSIYMDTNCWCFNPEVFRDFYFFFVLTFSSAQVRTVRPEANENVVVGHDK